MCYILQSCRFVSSAGLIQTILLVTDMREASRRLSQSLYDAYETDWAGEEDLGAIVEVCMNISDNIKPRAAPDLPLHICVLQVQKQQDCQGNKTPSLSFSSYIINAIFMLRLLIRERTSCGMTWR